MIQVAQAIDDPARQEIEAAPWTIPGSTMRLVLRSMQEISGRQYGLLLRQAGLLRFLDTLPPDDQKPVIASEELQRLYLTIYQVLGETLARLFHRNMGPSLAAAVLASPWGRALLLKAPHVPPEERPGWFVREMAAITSQSWAPQTVTEDAVAWYIESSDCRVCRGIHNARAPYCVAADVTYRLVGERVLGTRIRATEVACAAMGAPHCKHAIYK